MAKTKESNANRAHPDSDQHIPVPVRGADVAPSPGDGNGHATSDWERVYLDARPRRLAGASERPSELTSPVKVVEEHARESAHQDELAWRRDLAAEARDREAERRDRAMLEQEHVIARNGSAGGALEHSAELRAYAATARAQAAEDRRLAALDRLRASEERVEAVKALSAAELDDLTGVYRRGIGEQALKAEIERARRDGNSLVLAILDVQGLKEVNDAHGHLAGDRLLCDVVASIQTKIRSYEPIVRLGGDEFAFTIAGLDWEGASERISMMRAELARRPSRGRFWIGLTNVLPDDGLSDAMARADAALIRSGGANGDRPR